MCIYGMEGPGGYQLFGRTSQVWNTYRQTAAFTDGRPWLLRFFDQVKFYSVTAEELRRFRDGVIDGTAVIQITDTTFSMKDYRAFLAANADDIRAAKVRQQEAFDAERTRWQAADRNASANEAASPQQHGDLIPAGWVGVESNVPGCIWKIAVGEGARVSAGDVVVIVESMKMEMSVLAPCDGVVSQIRCAEGKPVALGQVLLTLSEVTAEAAQ